MLIKNIDDTLVNGSMGTVVRFAEPDPDNSEYEDYRNPGKPTSKGSASSSSRADASLPRKKWPVVEFTCGRTVIMTPETWKVELPNGEAQVTRIQVSMADSHLILGLDDYIGTSNSIMGNVNPQITRTNAPTRESELG